MARKPRIEFAGAIYHVINRGDSGRNLFGQSGPAQTFEELLFETCERCGWELFAYCLMTDHYHLAFATPKGNLVEGMHRMQSAFSNRLKERFGHRGNVFERRYRSLLVEPGKCLADVVDFIHLNPVRSGLRSVYNLESYPWSSFSKYLSPDPRPTVLRAQPWLGEMSGVTDGPEGWREYRERLGAIADLSWNEQERYFGNMSRGWVLGSAAYRRDLKRRLREMNAAKKWGRETSKAVNEAEWATLAAICLQRLGKTAADIAAEQKSAEWKAAIAAFLKRRTSVTNPWLSTRLNMGPPAMVSRLTTAYGSLPAELRGRYEARFVR